MNPPIIKTYKLADTPAEKDYRGCGWSVLVLRRGVPSALVYTPVEDGADFEAAYKGGQFHIRMEDAAAGFTDVYFGMASCYEFNAMKKLA